MVRVGEGRVLARGVSSGQGERVERLLDQAPHARGIPSHEPIPEGICYFYIYTYYVLYSFHELSKSTTLSTRRVGVILCIMCVAYRASI